MLKRRAADLSVLRGRGAALAVFALIGLLAGGAYGLADQPVYSATATVIAAGSDPADSAAGSLDPADPDGATRLEQLASSRVVALAAAGELGGDVAGGDLLSRTTFSARRGALIVRSTADFADFAAAAANAYATAIVDTAKTDQRRRLGNAADKLREQISGLDPASAEAGALSARLAEIEARADLGTPLVAGREASLPTAPQSDRSAPIWAGIGAAGGLAVGILVLMAGGLPRRSIADGPALAELLEVELLATLPELDPLVIGTGDGGIDLDSERAGPLHELASMIGDGDGPHTLAVLSAESGEGADSLALAIAVAAAEQGTRVLLMEADMRSPSMAERLGIQASPGLADYLDGGASPRQVMQPLAVPSAGDRPPVLVCVPAGSVGDGSPELLAQSRFADLVQRVGRVYDLIVLHSSPLLDSADGGGGGGRGRGDRSLHPLRRLDPAGPAPCPGAAPRRLGSRRRPDRPGRALIALAGAKERVRRTRDRPDPARMFPTIGAWISAPTPCCRPASAPGRRGSSRSGCWLPRC